MTWELADKVPAAIVEEFEKGAVSTMKELVASSGVGQTTHTLTVEGSGNRSKQSRIVVKENEGYSACLYEMDLFTT